MLKSELDEKIKMLNPPQNGDKSQNNVDDMKQVSRKVFFIVSVTL